MCKAWTGLVIVSPLVKQLLGWRVVNQNGLLGNRIWIALLRPPHFYPLCQEKAFIVLKTRQDWTSAVARGRDFKRLRLCSSIIWGTALLLCLWAHSWMQMGMNMFLCVKRRCCILWCCKCSQSLGLVGSNCDFSQFIWTNWLSLYLFAGPIYSHIKGFCFHQ